MKLIKEIGEGRTANIYLLEENKILKLLKNKNLLKDAQYEYKISKLLNENNILSPKTYGLVEHEGKPGIIFEYIQGETMLKKIQKNPFFILTFSKILTDLHLYINSRSIKEIPSLKEYLIENINKTDLLSEEKKQKIIEIVKSTDEDNKICHGDFHPDNILMSNNKPIIIDWLNCKKGNPKLDFARSYILINYGSLPSKISMLEKIFVQLIRKLLLFNYIKRYKKKYNITKKDFNKYLICVCAARLNEKIPKQEKKKLLKIINKILK